MTDATDLDILTRVRATFEQEVERIEDNQWALTTPCTDWCLEQLLDHVTGGNWFTVRILDGEAANAALEATRKQFGGDHDPRIAALSSIGAVHDALAAPGALDRTYHHVAGELPGRQVLRLRLHDLIIHTWDIAQTTGPPADLPDRLVQWGLDELAGPDSMSIHHFELDEPNEVDRAASPQTMYLKRFGR